MNKRTLVVGLITLALLMGATGCGNLDLGILNGLVNPSQNASAVSEEISKVQDEASRAMAEASKEAAEAIKQAEQEAKRAMEEASKAVEEARKQAEEEARAIRQSIENKESYSSGNTSNNNSSSRKVPVSGTWYGPKNTHTGDQSIVELHTDGSAKVTIDLGASEWAVFNATYTSEKAGPYEYDDIVCRVTLSGNTSKYGFPSNTFTFKIDPEVENGMYAVFVDSGFGMTPGGSTFTK